MARESPRRMRAIAARTLLGVPVGAQREVSADARWGGMRGWAKVPPITLDGLGASQKKPLQLRNVKNINPRRFVVPLIGVRSWGRAVHPRSQSSLQPLPTVPGGPLPPIWQSLISMTTESSLWATIRRGLGWAVAGLGEEVLNPSGPMPPNQVQASEPYLEGHLRGGGRCMDTRAR